MNAANCGSAPRRVKTVKIEINVPRKTKTIGTCATAGWNGSGISNIEDYSLVGYLTRIAHKSRKKDFTLFRVDLSPIFFRAAQTDYFHFPSHGIELLSG